MDGTLFEYARHKGVRTVHGLRPRAATLPQLRVGADGGAMGGLWTDVRSPAEGRIVIGGSDDADVVLIDDCVEGKTVEVRTVRSPIGAIAHITARSPDVTIKGVSIGADGVWERLPCRVEMSGIPVTLAAPPLAPDRALARRLGLAAAVCALLAGGASLWRVVAPASSVPTPAAAALAAPPAAKAPFAGLAEFETALTDAGLTDGVRARVNADGALVVEGALSEERYGLWRSLRRDWEARSGALPISGRVERMPTLDRLPPIAAVRFGSDPYVMLAADGTRIRPGEPLIDDWTLSEIREDGLTLTRGPDEVEVAL